MGYCCIPCCKTTQRLGISFHRFPTSIDSKRKWISVISHQGNPRNCNWTPTGRSTICSQHFKENDYSISTTKKILLPSAVPSVFEDLVAQKMARRQKQAKSGKDSIQNRLNKTKKATPKINSMPSEEETVKRGRGRQKNVKNTTKQITVIPNGQKSIENDECLSAKIRKSTRGVTSKQPDKKDLLPEKEKLETTTDISEEITEITPTPTKNVNSENLMMPVDDDTSECATLPLTEEYSATGSECDRSESLFDSTPLSRSIKSKSLQTILQKLITTIENQRAEISKLKKERDSLNRQLYNLKKEQIKRVYVNM